LAFFIIAQLGKIIVVRSSIKRQTLVKIIVIARQNDETVRLCSELNMHGFQCIFTNSNNALEQVRKSPAKLLLIEFNGLPEIESLCQCLRQESGLPIIALTPIEILSNLDGYADDFVIKPYNITELQVRANRLIKKKTEASGQQINIGSLKIDLDKYEIFVDDRLISLTFKEYELLRHLASHPGKVYTRDALLNHVWGEDYFGGDRTVDVYIRRLRSKIEGESHNFIETVRNIGYRFISS
jgi:DNA-binding response OmpR family regulator